MPHSPRLHEGQLYVLDSGRGWLVRVDRDGGQVERIAEYPGYGRGLSFCGQFAFVGMSKARESSVFGGVPICEDRSAMRCGVVVIDLVSRRSVAYLEFKTGVDELFDLQVLPEVRSPVICGPYPSQDKQSPVWVVPPPELVGELLDQSKIAAISRRQPTRSSLN